MRVSGQVGLLAAAALLAGVLRNLALSPPLPWTRLPKPPLAAEARADGIRLISREEVVAASETGSPLIFDARSMAEYDRGHIPGALSAPASEAAARLAEWIGLIGPDEPVIVYCGHPACSDALILGRILRGPGDREVWMYLDGMSGWRAAGGPEE